MSTVFVTGGAGFIGSAVIRHLIGKTTHRVINVDKLTYAADLAAVGSELGQLDVQIARKLTQLLRTEDTRIAEEIRNDDDRIDLGVNDRSPHRTHRCSLTLEPASTAGVHPVNVAKSLPGDGNIVGDGNTVVTSSVSGDTTVYGPSTVTVTAFRTFRPLTTSFLQRFGLGDVPMSASATAKVWT